MNLDRELRDALRPLAGDPVDDAQAVLAALEDAMPIEDVTPEPVAASGPEPAPRGPIGLPLAAVLLGVLALGIVLGLATSSALTPSSEDVASTDGTTDGSGDGQTGDPNGENPDGQPEDWDPQDPQNKNKNNNNLKPSPAMESGLYFTNFLGKIEIDEPGEGVQVLEPLNWRCAWGTQFRTQQAFAGIYVYGSDIAVRLDRHSVALIDESEFVLQTGRLWMAPMGGPEQIKIEAGFATILTGNTEVIVDRKEKGCAVLVLSGFAKIKTVGGDSRRVTQRTRVWIDEKGSISRPERIPFVPAVTGWMVPMVLLQQDAQEMNDNIEGLVEAYVAGRFREEAVLELRRYGARIVPLLYEYTVEMRDAALREKTARMIERHAEFSQAAWLFAMLESNDVNVRSSGFRALERVVGGAKNAMKDLKFWREASVAEREEVLAQWRERLR